MRAEIQPPTDSLLTERWDLNYQTESQETQDLYWFRPPLWCNTLLQCVVWWIASWADDDEQYKEEQPREGLFLAEAMNCWEEFSRLSLSLSALLWLTDSLAMWVAGPIYRGRGPLPKY